jgi:hypothetical protein
VAESSVRASGGSNSRSKTVAALEVPKPRKNSRFLPELRGVSADSTLSGTQVGHFSLRDCRALRRRCTHHARACPPLCLKGPTPRQ